MSDLMYTPLENVFADTMAREGKSITAVISGKTFTAFFRRCDDGQSTEDRIMLYYGVDAPVNQAILKKETLPKGIRLEKCIWHRKD